MQVVERPVRLEVGAMRVERVVGQAESAAPTACWPMREAASRPEAPGSSSLNLREAQPFVELPVPVGGDAQQRGEALAAAIQLAHLARGDAGDENGDEGARAEHQRQAEQAHRQRLLHDGRGSGQQAGAFDQRHGDGRATPAAASTSPSRGPTSAATMQIATTM